METQFEQADQNSGINEEQLGLHAQPNISEAFFRTEIQRETYSKRRNQAARSEVQKCSVIPDRI